MTEPPLSSHTFSPFYLCLPTDFPVSTTPRDTFLPVSRLLSSLLPLFLGNRPSLLGSHCILHHLTDPVHPKDIPCHRFDSLQRLWELYVVKLNLLKLSTLSEAQDLYLSVHASLAMLALACIFPSPFDP